jgi:hypothetical protein
MTRLPLVALLGLSAGLFTGPVTAQERAPGWIGISFEVSWDRRGRATDVEITDVRRNSPAEAAGLRAGDRLLAVNDLDRPSELARLRERLRPRAGDRIRIVVERDGRRRQVRLRAAEQPRDFTAARRLTLSFEPDSMVDAMTRAMDSLRVRLVESRDRTASVPGKSRWVDSEWTVVASGQNAVQAPFEFFVFRGEAHDSLQREMVELNRRITELERRIVVRARQVERAPAGVSRVRERRDPELIGLQEELEEASRRSAGLQAAMAESARSTAGLEYAVVAQASDAEPPRARPRSEEYRPLTPYLLGRNRVAGAEVIDLRPQLAAYFDVEGGVLVIDVAPRTPAGISGIIPGDVITHLDQVVVRSVEDLRFGVSQAGDTLPISLIRKGNSVQILLRR